MGNNLIKSIFEPGKANDIIVLDKDNPLYAKAKKRREEMTGWERVNFVFSLDEYGDFTPEMHRIKDASFIAMFVGGILGGVGRSRVAYMDFFRQNTATQFETPLQAKKALQDKVTIGMGSGAFRIGWRMSAFTFIYMTGETIIAAYRGKYGIIDQVGGAGMAGCLYKLRDGPKAAVSGTVFGSILGLMAGCLTLICIKVFNFDMESANMEYYNRLNKRLENEKGRVRRFREESGETDSLELMHEQFVASMNSRKKKEGGEGPSSEKDSNKVQTLTEKVESRMKAIESTQSSSAPQAQQGNG